MNKKSSIKDFVKTWLLVFAMSAGGIGFFLLDGLVHEPASRKMIVDGVTGILPYLLFAMLFLEFSKINPTDLFPKRWIIYSFIYQFIGALAMIAILLWGGLPTWTEGLWGGTLTCLLVPTATAVAVMSSKLGGNAASATTYTVLASLFTAVAIPLLFPLVAVGNAELSFGILFTKIFAKIFPVIIVPLVISLLMRKFTPKWHEKTACFAKDKSYYLWAFCISINMAQIMRIICQGLLDGWTTVLYCLFAGLICVINFMVGKKIGETSDDRISGGQSLGQKNTILAIWIAMTYLNPTSGIVMGAYMIWQNICNTLQLSYPKLR